MMRGGTSDYDPYEDPAQWRRDALAYDGPTAAQDKADADELVRARARRNARRELDAETAAQTAPDLARFSLSLREELVVVPEDPGWAVESIARPGHIATLPSVRKTGKTTFLGNLAWCGVDDEPFLGRLDCSLDGNVAAVNAEMTRDDYLWTYRQLGIKHDNRLFMLHCLDESLRLNLLSDVVCERFIKWLVSRDASWLFLDPWKNFLAWAGLEINDNKGANDLLVRIQQIRSEAGLAFVVIPMNTPQATPSAGSERAKGAGEVEDGADVLWRYTPVDGATDAPRVLSCRGRGGISVANITVAWDAGTGRLSSREGSREEARDSFRAREAAEALALELINRNVDALNTGEFDALIRGEKSEKLAVRSAAVELGMVVVTPGTGRTKWYSLPEE